MGFRTKFEIESTMLGPVVRKVDSAIHRIVIFSNFLKLFINWYKLIKVQYFEVKVSFY